MPTIPIHCPVLGAEVIRVTDIHGEPTLIICPEFEKATKGCRLKKHASDGGPLSQFLARIEEHTLDMPGGRCGFA